MSIKAMKPVPSWVVRNGSDWAFIQICDDTGSVSITSSYGNYNFIWRSIGDKTLLEFVCKINFDYAMGKFLGLRSQFSFEKTMRIFKDRILEDRRLDDLSADDARLYWDELKKVEYTDSDSEFVRQIEQTKYSESGHDWWECTIMDHPTEARIFWDTLWKEFVEAAKAGELSGVSP